MTTTRAIEANFDCLVGPTHHFGGLSLGNLASTNNKSRAARPKMAALQGLKKMKFLADRGFVQGVFPPHPRPHMKTLRSLGFMGTDQEIIKAAREKMPQVLSSLSSSSFMWAANSATFCPSFDSSDKKAHMTPANLTTMFHRSIEHEFATKVFQKIFHDQDRFLVHNALIPHDIFSDEGAANHNRLCPSHGSPGLQIFVWGKESAHSTQKSRIYPARQSSLANEALALRHRLKDNWLNLEQNAKAIDAGAFHNDVVAVTNENVLLCHELAFSDQLGSLRLIKQRYQELFNETPVIIEILDKDLPIADAVSSYLFNSQLLTKKDGQMMIFAPTDCQKNGLAHAAIKKIISQDNPINEVEFFDVSESMANGGGPACLRLRVVLSEAELKSIKQSVILTDKLYEELCHIIENHYVDELRQEHFFDEKFLKNCQEALQKIGQSLGLSSIYDFS